MTKLGLDWRQNMFTIAIQAAQIAQQRGVYYVITRLAKLTLVVRETGLSRYNGGPIKGPP